MQSWYSASITFDPPLPAVVLFIPEADVGDGVPPKFPTPALVRISPVHPLAKTSRTTRSVARAGTANFTLSQHPVGGGGI
jgi:hypothetical protein